MELNKIATKVVHASFEGELEEASSLLQTSEVQGDGKSPALATGNKAHQKSCVCCKRCKSVARAAVRPLLWKHYDKPTDDASLTTRVQYALLCPPHGAAANVICFALATILAWGLLWAITGADGLPGGSFFGILVIFVACQLGGWLTAFAGLPALLGMLVVGCFLGNAPHLNFARHIDSDWSSALRTMALGIILLRAGLGLNPADLRRLSFAVVRLAFVPCTTEAVICMVASHLLLNMPWLWGLMLGFVLAAVSPAVVVPSMLALQERGLGTARGIPTLVLAAASIDDVLAISAFTVILGMTFSKGEALGMAIVRGPLEAVAGAAYGLIGGVLLWFIPASSKKVDCNRWRLVLLLGGGQFALFGSRALGVEGAGALGCLVIAFVASLRWRNELTVALVAGGTECSQMPVERTMRVLWEFWQPFLFGLIGAAVDISSIDLNMLGLGIAVLFIGLSFRMVASFFAVFGIGLTYKEKLFVSLAWLPKATVQAAIGSLAYDAADRAGDIAGKLLGLQILTIAVLSIVITAPAGAGAIAISAPCLLSPERNVNGEAKEVVGQATEDEAAC